MYNHRSRGLSKIKEHHIPDVEEVAQEIAFMVTQLDSNSQRKNIESRLGEGSVQFLESVARHVTYELALRNLDAEEISESDREDELSLARFG